MPNCIKCSVELIFPTNWTLACQRKCYYICRPCDTKRKAAWTHTSYEKICGSNQIVTCCKCGIVLNDSNWQPSRKRKIERICRPCIQKRKMEWNRRNPEKYRAINARTYEKRKRWGGSINPRNAIQKCYRCFVILNNTNWHLCNRKLGEYICINCERIRGRERWNKLTKEQRHEIKQHEKWRAYGLNNDAVAKILQKQNGGCAICETLLNGQWHEGPHVDHSHKTKQTRGILCLQCNSGLAFFMDSPQLLQRAIDYLSGRLSNPSHIISNGENTQILLEKGHLKNRHGITLEELNVLSAKQGGKCAICQSVLEKKYPFVDHSKKPCVDHDHVTKKIRGILCNKCNSGLGYFKDSVINLKRAIAYLNKYNN